MYKAIYNDVDLSYFGYICSITKSLIPKRTYTSYDINTIDGSIFNSSKYDSAEIVIKLFIEGSDINNFKAKERQLINLLNTKTPLPLVLDDNKFTYAITNDKVDYEKFSELAEYITINFICLDPYFYSLNDKLFNMENNNIAIDNEGSEKVLPSFSMAFSKDTHFVQLENENTGEKILIGKYPNLSLTTKKASTTILKDDCITTTNWVQANASIDSDRTTGGTMAMNKAGSGVMLGTLPSSSTTKWKGMCYRQTLSSSIDEFSVKCCMHHNSTGKTGDPSLSNIKEETGTTGVKNTIYVTKSSSTPYTDIHGKVKGYLCKGFQIFDWEDNNNTIKFPYLNSTYYVKKTSVSKKTVTSTNSATIKNYVVIKKTALMSAPRADSNVVLTLDINTVLRCVVYYYTDTNNTKKTYIKLDKKYKDKIGYVCTDDIVVSSEAVYAYDESDDYLYASGKTGINELYGFDENGSKLFKLSMIDDNEYFEYTRPQGQIGNKIYLKDSTTVPSPSTKYTATSQDGKYIISTTKYMGGKLGDWNEFYGSFIVTRKKVNNQYIWSLEVNKIKDNKVLKTMRVENIKGSDLPTGKLSSIVTYIGTSNENLDMSSDMDLTYVLVTSLNPESEQEEDITYFEENDILDVELETGKAYLNNKDCSNLIDIGSNMFNVDVGTNNIKIISDDDAIVASAVIKEKWMGSD